MGVVPVVIYADAQRDENGLVFWLKQTLDLITEVSSAV